MGVIRIIKVFVAVVVISALLFGGYVVYLSMEAARIPDMQSQEIAYIPSPQEALSGEFREGEKATDRMKTLRKGRKYTATTYNIGFGAYDHEFSFFLDTNKMKAGTETKGIFSRASSKKAAEDNTDACIAVIREQDPDFALFQEVDKEADRSQGVDQAARIAGRLLTGTEEAACWTFSTNMHTGYLLYPLTKPIGRVANSGLMTLSKFRMSRAERHSLPITGAFPDKFFDLDRCFSLLRFPVENKKGDRQGELVVINLHTSAYDKGGVIRKRQMDVLKSAAEKEYEKGNWVIIGGDFNHALYGTLETFQGEMQTPPWAQPFEDSMLPAGFALVQPDNAASVATCRDTSIPYHRGINYEVTLDGFMVSENVVATATNLDADYEGSDHNPVRLDFKLR
ncbi:MAG: endonuclease/exonuclease/phosphatase family protein [Clostridiales Family XIII bacterium]|jgi:endonuclease/exonuclease/phosphatase family metal-dependent hydrolase|nr:endonuclease/exonuclease/phosphatase family protein [Clostridiales Family XIII bacterium]